MLVFVCVWLMCLTSCLFLWIEHTNGDGDYTSSLLGILVMQDVHLGVLVALLPGLAGHRNVAKAKGNSASMVHGILNGLDHTSYSGILIMFAIVLLLGIVTVNDFSITIIIL